MKCRREESRFQFNGKRKEKRTEERKEAKEGNTRSNNFHLLVFLKSIEKEERKKERNGQWSERRTWVGRMAASRAERRWSKEPRMATMPSVLVWLFCRDSRTKLALCLRVSIACGVPIPQISLSLYRRPLSSSSPPLSISLTMSIRGQVRENWSSVVGFIGVFGGRVGRELCRAATRSVSRGIINYHELPGMVSYICNGSCVRNLRSRSSGVLKVTKFVPNLTRRRQPLL